MVKLIKLVARIIFGLLYKVEISGKENIPEKGAAVLCSNHNAELDMFFIGYKINRLIRWMAKEELFKVPIFRIFLIPLGAFPIKRGSADVDSIKTALKLLEEGHIIGIFPEGTRTRGNENKKARIKRGAVSLAIKADVPILPVCIEGSYKPFSKVRLVFGRPFKLDVDRNKKYSQEETVELTREIMSKVYGLLEEE